MQAESILSTAVAIEELEESVSGRM